MTRVLVDTSVLVKWFHTSGEREVGEARAIRSAHARGDLDAHIIDLAVYELGNVLLRALRWEATAVADQLADLLLIVGAPIAFADTWLGAATELAERDSLSFYDASWAAAAQALGIPLVSADRQLTSAGLAQTPAVFVQRFGLT